MGLYSLLILERLQSSRSNDNNLWYSFILNFKTISKQFSVWHSQENHDRDMTGTITPKNRIWWANVWSFVSIVMFFWLQCLSSYATLIYRDLSKVVSQLVRTLWRKVWIFFACFALTQHSNQWRFRQENILN